MSDIITIFREVRDPREPNARHDLGDVLFTALAAVLCGAKTCVDMAEFAEDRLEALREIVDLRHGAPSHDTFSRVFRLLDPAELARPSRRRWRRSAGSLARLDPKGWWRSTARACGAATRRAEPSCPFDGGRVRQPDASFDRPGQSAGRRRGQGDAGLLKGLVLKGCIVTADALHCHSAMAQGVREAKAHYALTLKGNQSALLADAQAAFAAAARIWRSTRPAPPVMAAWSAARPPSCQEPPGPRSRLQGPGGHRQGRGRAQPTPRARSPPKSAMWSSPNC